MSTYRNRRSPVLRWALCTAGAVAGIAIGIGVSMLKPWGFAPAPGSLPELVPQPGMMLQTIGASDMASISADTVRHFGPPAMAEAMALFVRGERNGQRSVLVQCHEGGFVWLAGEAPARWSSKRQGIADLIAQAACYGHPLLRQHQLEQTT
jgi:hypothetical protein